MRASQYVTRCKPTAGGVVRSGRSRPHWNASHADQKEGVRHLLVVRLGKETDARAFVWKVQGLEAGTAGPKEEGQATQGEAEGKRRETEGCFFVSRREVD
jgi:hypothetical protein